MINRTEWEWWDDILRHYHTLESVDDKEKCRLLVACLQFLVKAVEPDGKNENDN